MVKLKILSINIRGLNTNIKRVKCLELLHRSQTDIALIQESHLTNDNISKIQNRNYRVVASSEGESVSRGVIVLFRRSLNIKIDKVGNDNKGRMAYVCTTIEGLKIAFISIYGPNVFDKIFYPRLTEEILSLENYELIMGGDMNAVCDLELDRSTSTFTYGQQNSSMALNTMICDLNVVDIWRLQNPFTKDYNCFSPCHK